MASLEVMGPPAMGARFPLEPKRETVIGRSGFCEIVLAKRSISREHTRIFERDGEFYIMDLESVNGTFLNGHPIHDVKQLKDGDRINVFDVPMKFYRFDDPNAPSSGTIPVFNGAVPEPEAPVKSRQRVRLDYVLDIIQRLGSSLDINVILPKVLDLLFQTFPQAINGEILLVEPDNSLSPRASKHGREADSATLTVAPTDHFKVRETLASGIAIINVAGDASGDSALESSFASTMFVPIIGPTRAPLGIIVLETEDPHSRFDLEDLSLVNGVATITAQAIGYASAHELVVEHERNRHNLETAREIQLRMLPRDAPQVAGYSFSQYYRAAKVVGGDAYSYHMLPDGRVMLAVADAVGKGLSASLKIVEFISEIRHCVSTAPSLKSAMDYLNKFVCRSDDGFITFCLIVLDPQRNTLSIANAGHPLPLLRRREGSVTAIGLDRVSFPLGIVTDNAFHPLTVSLDYDDEFLLYTDGLTEAFNRAKDIYGNERLHRAMLTPADDANHRVQMLVEDVERFRQGYKQSDDQCLLVVRRNARPPKFAER